MKLVKSVPMGNGTVRSLTFFCSLILIVVLSSCGGQRRLQADIKNSRDKERGNFVQTKDGEIIEGESLKVKYPFFKKAYVEINKSEQVKLRDVLVLQNDEGYYRKVEGELIPRIKKGGINTYLTYRTTQTYEGPNAGNGQTGRWRTNTVPVYYVQKSDSGDVRLMTPAVINEFVSDYEPAKEYMDEYYRTQKKVRTWSWINTAAVVGGLVLVGTSVDDSEEGGSSIKQGYVGLGLFVGGIVNGIVNKVRRVKNGKNVELAIDEYNRGYNKKTETKKKK